MVTLNLIPTTEVAQQPFKNNHRVPVSLTCTLRQYRSLLIQMDPMCCMEIHLPIPTPTVTRTTPSPTNNILKKVTIVPHLQRQPTTRPATPFLTSPTPSHTRKINHLAPALPLQLHLILSLLTLQDQLPRRTVCSMTTRTLTTGMGCSWIIILTNQVSPQGGTLAPRANSSMLAIRLPSTCQTAAYRVDLTLHHPFWRPSRMSG